MVNDTWMEQKITQLENDRSKSIWNNIREQQLRYLLSLYSSGAFMNYSSEHILHRLALIFNGY